MKKWLIFIFVILLVLTAVFFVFIPAQFSSKQVERLNANHNAVYRALIDSVQWKNWWPADSKLVYEGFSYTIQPKAVDAAEVVIADGEKRTATVIRIIPVASDSLAIQWQFDLPVATNPANRLQHYLYGKKLQKNIDHIFSTMKEYMQVPQNLYGFDVEQTKVTDTLLVATRSETAHYPTTEDVYALVDKLNAYISRENATATNHPMLHISETDPQRFQFMVAIPVNKALADNGDIKMKKMVPGNILVTEVKGGNGKIRRSLNDFDNLISDYNRISPAMPFQLLVTDRREVRDTSRWITKLYYPIF